MFYVSVHDFHAYGVRDFNSIDSFIYAPASVALWIQDDVRTLVEFVVAENTALSA